MSPTSERIKRITEEVLYKQLSTWPPHEVEVIAKAISDALTAAGIVRTWDGVEPSTIRRLTIKKELAAMRVKQAKDRQRKIGL